MPSGPRTRASDADRDRVASLLQEHHAAGRLSAEEFSERLDSALRARTLDELDELLADLPHIDLHYYNLPDASLRRPPARGLLPAPGLPDPDRPGSRP
jgi:cobalamin biosynthesis protein CbiG